jgi:2-polyprenyl-3-methyl-5-hydroxy-6-metoxy-1,4-benzoquinol methylase
MARPFDTRAFDRIYDRFIIGGRSYETPDYYPRYRSRYRAVMQAFAGVAGESPERVLDVGGGQHALIAKHMWGDEATVADIRGPYFDYLHEQGISTVEWNLCGNVQRFENQFDAIFFCEVIEHLPIPGHVVLERLRIALRPGRVLICTTPNIYRLRNVVYLAIGKTIFDYFRMPTDRGLGHVIEYSQDHLTWQIEKAGFEDIRVALRQFHHNPHELRFRILSWLGYPLFLYPRFRDQLLAVARAPGNRDSIT